MNEKNVKKEFPETGGTDFPAYSEDGVDLSLVRCMLSLTPTERLRILQQNINALARLQNAVVRY